MARRVAVLYLISICRIGKKISFNTRLEIQALSLTGEDSSRRLLARGILTPYLGTWRNRLKPAKHEPDIE